MSAMRLCYYLTAALCAWAAHGDEDEAGGCVFRARWQTELLLKPVTRKIWEHQIDNCDPNPRVTKFRTHVMDEHGGMGHDIFDWSGMLCYNYKHNTVTVMNGDWCWSPRNLSLFPPTDCALERPVNQQPRKTEQTREYDMLAKHHLRGCGIENAPPSQRSGASRRYAANNFLLRYLPPIVRKRACAARREVYGDDVPDPADQITVHIRRGDKCMTNHCEMHFIGSMHYINATRDLIAKKGIEKPTVFLTTEDRGAINEFRALAAETHPDWRVVHYDRAVLPSNTLSPGLEAQKTEEAREGMAALPSLIALVLGLESNTFILTLLSDWSTLIDSIRDGRVDPLCDGCTTLLDITHFGTSDLGATEAGGTRGVGAKDIV